METIVVPIGYTEHPPPPDLAEYVRCFWTGLALPSNEGATHRVLPDGSVDIIAEFGGDGDSELRDVYGIGAMTRPLVVGARDARLYVAARFAPGMAFAAFGIPASELTDE